jgi:uncharacterized protein (TIGR03066 family)
VGDLPQAPEPRPKAEKTKAELLIGTWKLVETLNKQLLPKVDARIEFTKDGKFTTSVNEPKQGLPARSGTYTLNGNTIRLTKVADEDGPDESWDVTIESLTEVELKAIAGPSHDRQRSVFRRLEQK